MEINFIIMH